MPTVELEKIIKYNFKRRSLLENALRHSSYANEVSGLSSNERLEFLGDSVLGIVTAEYLYRSFKHLPEGELTKLRSSLVCEKSLVGFAREIHLGEFLYLGKGELNTGGRERTSILADAFEALIAAIYLDGGIECAREFVLRFIKPALKHKEDISFKDYKTTLQEVIQQNKEEKLRYVLTNESGPDHDKCFEVELLLNSNVIGRGAGHSKKEAEQQAAKEALELMGV